MLNYFIKYDVYMIRFFTIWFVIVSIFVIHTAYAENEPVIVYQFRNDPKSTPVSGLDKGDTISIIFSPATNEILKDSTNNKLNKANVDSIFTFSTSIGTDYTGRWVDPYVFEITIVDPGGVSSGDLSSLTITVKTSVGLKNAELTSDATDGVGTASFFQGNFDSLSDPFITGFVADDPDNSDSTYSNGDTITIRFNEPTNQPLKGSDNLLVKADVNKLFGFGQNGGEGKLGDDYSGTWLDSRTFQITVKDITSAAPPKIGQLNVTAIGKFNSIPIKNAAGTSSGDLTAVYANLTGSFKKFSETKDVADGGKLFTRLPSGPYQLFKPNSGATESISVSTTTASKKVANGEATFVGNVVEITGSSDTCKNSCTVTYQVTKDDLDRVSVSSSDLRILHDQNDDGDFDESGEVLESDIVSGNLPNSFIVTASDDKISKFAVGGVVGTTANAAAGIGAAGAFLGLIKDKCDEDGFGQGQSLKIYKISYDKCDANKIEIQSYSTCGPIKARIGTERGLALAGMPSDQPFLNNETKKIVFSHSIDESTEWFNVVIQDERDEYIQKIFANQCTGELKFAEDNTYTSEQQSAVSVLEKVKTIPEWIKNNAEWWAQGQIDDSTFVEGMEFLIKSQIINVAKTTIEESEVKTIPEWIKNNAEWWAQGQIDDSTFVEGMEFLIKKGIISVN